MKGKQLGLLVGLGCALATSAMAAPLTGEYPNKNSSESGATYSFDAHAPKVHVFLQFGIEVC